MQSIPERSNRASGQYKDFNIILELNSADVLTIQALNRQNLDHYFFAINKTYIEEHPRFTNVITEPKQILQFFQTSFEKATFDGGQLTFYYGGNHPINILLLKDPAIAPLRQKIDSESNNQRISDLQVIVKQIKKNVEGITSRVGNMEKEFSLTISRLKERDQQFDDRLAKLDQRQAQIADQLQRIQDKNRKLLDIMKGLKIEDISLQDQINKLIDYKQQDKIFTNYVRQRLETLERELRQNNQSLNNRIGQINLEIQQLRPTININRQQLIEHIFPRGNQFTLSNQRLSTFTDWVGFASYSTAGHPLLNLQPLQVSYLRVTQVASSTNNFLIRGRGFDRIGPFEIEGTIFAPNINSPFRVTYLIPQGRTIQFNFVRRNNGAFLQGTPLGTITQGFPVMFTFRPRFTFLFGDFNRQIEKLEATT